MKLANSWVEEPPTQTPSEQLYDELDESDEVDESKDGCCGVCWWEYVLRSLVPVTKCCTNWLEPFEA